MAGLGILGTALAGALKGGSDATVEVAKQQQEFNIRKALLEADYDMRSRLEQAGIKNKQKAADDYRSGVKRVMDEADAKDPNAGKGGYETDEMKSKSQRAGIERRRQGLIDAGYLDEADKLDNQLARMDKSEATAAALDIKGRQIDNAYSQGQEKLRLQGEANAAKVAAEGAKAEAAKAKSERGFAPTNEDKDYQAYVEDVKTNGRKTTSGTVSFKPMSRDKWTRWNKDRDAQFKDRPGTESRKRVDEATGEEVTTVRPLPRSSGLGDNDPLGLFKK